MEIRCTTRFCPVCRSTAHSISIRTRLRIRGRHRRQEWFGCACCPPNIARLLASLPGYFYSVAEYGVYTHLYATGTATIPMPDGGTVTLQQQTDYPYDGAIEIKITENSTNAEYLYLRIPAWAHVLNGSDGVWPIEVNGVPARIAAEPGTYAKVLLGAGETFVSLKLPMDVERVQSHPHVLNNRGRVALQRGPLIYCIEQADNAGVDVWDVILKEDETALKPEFVADLLNGVVVLRGQASGAKNAGRT